jgi:hypothetical protein
MAQIKRKEKNGHELTRISRIKRKDFLDKETRKEQRAGKELTPTNDTN